MDDGHADTGVWEVTEQKEVVSLLIGLLPLSQPPLLLAFALAPLADHVGKSFPLPVMLGSVSGGGNEPGELIPTFCSVTPQTPYKAT